MAEALSEAVKSTGVKISWESGGQFLIDISTESVEVAKEMCKTAIKLSALYVGYQLLRPVIDAAIKKALGGERDDQEVKDIKPGSLHIVLHCFTDERFLEVLTDYLSGKMKERLEEEFSQVGIKVNGLKVEIQNMAEVNERKEAICKRFHIDKNLCKDVKNTAVDDGESDKKKNVGETESQMSAVTRKQDEINEIVDNVGETMIVSTAATSENVPEGYDVTRFVGEVKEDLLCLICNEVPKDPRLCKNKDHVFCRAHISKHLENFQTCPYCRDPLTPETLRRPTGFLKKYLDEMKIKCDHHDRGCPDVVRLEYLPKHVDQCEFAPLMCGNEGCGMVVNKSEKENHEKHLCKFRIAMCHDCTEIRANQDEMKANQEKWNDEMKLEFTEMKHKISAMERKQDEAKDEMKVELNKMKDKMTGIERKQDQMQDEMKVELTKMKDNMSGIERKQDRMQQSVDEMKQQFEKMMRMFHQALQGSNLNNIGAQATDPRASANNQDIIILGGYYAPGIDKISTTVEKFNVAEGKSTKLPPMNYPRVTSASCVYNGDVIVTGGYDGQDGYDSIEILKMTQEPLQWTMFGGKLPVKLSSHSAIIYQNKLYVIGGCNWTEQRKTSDIIYEVELVPPYSAKILARMPRVRRNHGTEIVDGKLFIFGGSTTRHSKDAVDSVLVYDFIMNEVKPCPSLPKPVCFMSTVSWGNTIIVVGGQNKNDKDLNDVIMYDTETGRNERLPSLKHMRRGPSAVVIDDVIVVLGGWNKEQGYLNSVESFTMGSDGWTELPGMKEKRQFATAVVIPRISNVFS